MSNVHALVEAPVIYLNCCGSLSVRILGQEQLDAFFAKIERGGLPGASDDEKRHCIQAKEIKKLDCDGKEVPDDKKIEQLPKEIGKLTSLTWLDLENNQLTSLPGEIGKLTNICERRNCRKYLTDHDRFDVAYNFINYIPREFRDYPGFSNAFDNSVFLDSPPVPQPDKAGVVILNHPQDRIWLSDKFRKNPEFKKRVKCIEYREIFEGGGPPQSCVVGCWPTDAGSPPENKVTIGFESRDQLENFVFELEHFKWGEEELERIQVLHLANLGLIEIPKFVFKCKNLERLFLEDNYIEEVPEIISRLKKLAFLHLGNNRIHQLPISLGKLTNLRGLLLDVNPLDAAFPIHDVSHLEFLEFISLDSGVAKKLFRLKPLTHIDQKIMDSGIPDMSVMVKPIDRNNSFL